jgi:chorismate--pyruvate lyase
VSCIESLPIWRTQGQLLHASTLEAEWLFDQGSLTERLRALSGQTFRVCPVLEAWQPLRADECEALGVEVGCLGWVREVYLLGKDQRWVFARSVASHAALAHSALELQQLGSRSLGELLFSDQAFRRGSLQACRYPRAWLPERIQQDGLWGRRSCFVRERLAVLVAEVFLPQFWRVAGAAES